MAAIDHRSIANPPADFDTLPIDDPLLSFAAEAELGAVVPPLPVVANRRRSSIVMGTIVAAVLVVMAFAAVQARRIKDDSLPLASAATGLVEITSRPAGAAISVDGERRGITPLRVPMTAGSHVVDVTSGRMTSSLPLSVDAGSMLHQHIEFAADNAPSETASPIIAATPEAITGNPLSTSSGPAAPAAAAAVTTAAVATVVTAIAGAPEAVPVVGWARVTAPIELQVSERGRPFQLTPSGRIRLTAGHHQLDVLNPSFDFQTTLRLDVVAGKTITVPIELPNGVVSINAVPWANVSVDARAIGVTPIGNLSLPIGLHEVTWRHPQLGERRQTISVTERSPVGIGMDFSR